MSKTVGFLNKKWDEAIQDSLADYFAAMSVFAHYGIKNITEKEQAAVYMLNLLGDMNENSRRFKNLIQSSPEEIGAAQFYRCAIMQDLGFISLEQEITKTFLSQPSITSNQNFEVSQQLRYELIAPTYQIQKNFVGVMISYFINELTLTAGNSGFASACFVVAKKLDLQNIAPNTWRKMINSANFSAGFWEKGSSQSRRRAELLHITRTQDPGEAADVAPPYSEVDPSSAELPPPYAFEELLPLEPPPAYDEEETVLETIEIPHAF